ncbi:MAG TPA: hypothetical protein VMS17_12245 [Gemmataceae bacterium]|nr:hypothetical protein [Gemmataceae bacterium]
MRQTDSSSKWTALLKSYYRYFDRYKELHLVVGFVLFIASLLLPLGEVALAIEIPIWTLTALFGLCLLVFWVAKLVHNPFPPPREPTRRRHLLELFLTIPDYRRHLQSARFPRYRYRRIRAERTADNREVPIEADLVPFVEFSHDALHAAHPDLTKEERRELYEGWWQCNHDSFLFLEKKRNEGARPEVIAVSIILPLSDGGHKHLRDGVVAVIKLRGQDIEKTAGASKHLLIDTWIIAKSHRRKHDPFVLALVLKHLSLFWNPQETPEMTLLIEPDVRSVRTFLAKSFFSGPTKTADKGDLYWRHFPHDYVDDNVTGYYHQLLSNIARCREWPLRDL